VFAQLQNNFGGTFRADESNADLNQKTMLIEKGKSWIRRDQRTVSFASRAARRPVALRRRPFHFANRALVTSGIGNGRKSGGLPSADRRRRCALATFR
jgi:hypothetical protein